MDDQNKNLILATALSFLVILVWFVLFPPPEPQAPTDSPVSEAQSVPGAAPLSGTGGTAATPLDGTSTTALDGADAPRVDIETPHLKGSLSLQGGRIDELSLKTYRVSLAEDAPIVQLFKPETQPEAYYALYGWSQGGALTVDDVPTPTTVWTLVSGDTLTPDTPITIGWDNTKGQQFRRTISIDDDYMFTVTQSVTNTSGDAIRVAPYGLINRHGEPSDQVGFFIIHEGAIRQSGEELNEFDYGDIRDLDADPRWGPSAEALEVQSNGWLGFTDHYWMSTLIPASDAAFTSALQYDAGRDIFRATAMHTTIEVGAGETAEVTSRLFAGAKEWETIRNYERTDGVYKFIDSIDWGWFFFLTKPIFWLLHWMNAAIGNMGWAIIGLTFVIKALLFPLAYKSYSSMAKMKELQPEMEKIKERAGDDRQKMQKEMMELYKKEKVNPAAGCLPILFQIPIFFSLYKVIYVTIELRHAPWFGWIKDLSAPDPSSFFNLWGIFPWDAPQPDTIMALIFIGILPLILGVSMWLQQKLNPAPTDPTQQMIFAWMPWVFMFMLGSFASGLVIYWIANNLITFAQQYLIMRSQGYTPDVFGNITASFKRKPAEETPAPEAKKKPQKNSKK